MYRAELAVIGCCNYLPDLASEVLGYTDPGSIVDALVVDRRCLSSQEETEYQRRK
jgi:hypothetical protein